MNNWLELFPENILERGVCQSFELYEQTLDRNSFWHGRL